MGYMVIFVFGLVVGGFFSTGNLENFYYGITIVAVIGTGTFNLYKLNQDHHQRIWEIQKLILLRLVDLVNQAIPIVDQLYQLSLELAQPVEGDTPVDRTSLDEQYQKCDVVHAELAKAIKLTLSEASSFWHKHFPLYFIEGIDEYLKQVHSVSGKYFEGEYSSYEAYQDEGNLLAELKDIIKKICTEKADDAF